MQAIERFGYLLQRTFTSRIVSAFWDMFILVLPYFILGILLVAFLVRLLPRLDRWPFFRSDSMLSIVIAALFGLISPLGTYIVVPIGAAMINMGFAVSPIIAFMVASPLINPNIFILTVGVLGIEMALARLVSAWLLGIFGGWVSRKLLQKHPIFFQPRHQANIRSKKERSYWGEVWAHTRFVGKYFLIALLLSAMVRVMVPGEWIARTLGTNATMGVLIAVAMGVPLYSCGGAAIPIMKSLVDLGMAQGPVLAFFISGPATKLDTLYVFRSTFTSRVLLFYLSITLIGAVVFGYLFGLV